MSVQIIIGGDIVPTVSNRELFASGNLKELIGADLIKELNDVDFTLFNLEVPLTNQESPIEKCGPNLIAPIETIKGLRLINPHFFTLANNHILDQGKEGLLSTINLLKKNNIAYAGAGRNLEEASQGYINKIDEIKVGVYCCAEHEFSTATEYTAGANPFDPLESLDHIIALKEEVDYLIVLFHGGKEHYRFPSPNLQKICRKMIDKGADLVVCQHSHCIGCEERWNNGVIIYGQGNFLFDNSNSEYWKTGLLIYVELDIKNSKLSHSISYIPIKKIDNKVRKADSLLSKKILQEFFMRTENIKEKNFIKDQYAKFSYEMQWKYFSAFAGKTTRNIIYRIINRLSKYKFMEFFLSKKYKKRDRLVIQNYIECEAHRELFLNGLKINYPQSKRILKDEEAFGDEFL